MKTEVITITYGVKQSLWKGRPRFFAIIDGRESCYMHYARHDFCLQKAESFCKTLFKPHANFSGEVFFEYNFVRQDR